MGSKNKRVTEIKEKMVEKKGKENEGKGAQRKK